MMLKLAGGGGKVQKEKRERTAECIQERARGTCKLPIWKGARPRQKSANRGRNSGVGRDGGQVGEGKDGLARRSLGNWGGKNEKSRAKDKADCDMSGLKERKVGPVD